MLRHTAVVVTGFLFMVVAGCGGDGTGAGTWRKVSPAQLNGPARKRFQRAERARKTLARTLFGRLSEVLSRKGAAEAIRVCRIEAQGMTGRVGGKFDVNIGRTSFRLRNPNNTPPDWARRHNLVENRVDRQVVLRHAKTGTVAVLTPIHLKKKCTVCHGPKEQLSDSVKTRLTELYPRDEATGFRPGELRGWFWVEAPPDGQ